VFFFFKFGGYIQRINSLVKVVSQSGDFMDVQIYPYNNNGNKNYQTHYYNIIVRVENKLKYQSGFCINSTPQPVKGLFSQEFNPTGVKSEKTIKCPIQKRDRVKRKCKKEGIRSKAGLLRCIIDVCYKMLPAEERAREILKDEVKLEKVKIVKIVTPKPEHQKEGMCYSLGDPHYTTFNGRKFDNYFIGDWVLVSADGFTIHARTRKWGNASVNKRISANLSGDIVEAKSADKFTLNGDTEVDLKVGQKYRLPKGGLVQRISATRSLYYSYKKGYLDAEYLGTGKTRYVNLIVKVPHYPSTTGACQGNMIAAHGLFKKELNFKKRKHDMIVSKNCHDKARLICKNKGINRRFIGSCIIDVCAGLGTKGMRKGIRHVKQDK